MNKLELKIHKEKELLSLILKEPGNINLLIERIPIELFSKKHLEVFENLYEKKILDETAVLFEIKKTGLPAAEYVSIAHQLGNMDLRIKEFYDISDSLRIDELLNHALLSNKDKLNGLDLLDELKTNIECELKKYSRFEVRKTFDEKISEIMERISTKNKNDVNFKTPGFPSFITATGGLNAGNLIAIAGAYKNGKTTLGLNLLIDLYNQLVPVALYSFEMSEPEIEDRVLSLQTGIDHERIRNPKRLESEDVRKIIKYKNDCSASNRKLVIIDRVLNINELENDIARLKKSHGIKAILIDYIGLIKSTSKKGFEFREREVSHFSNSLKRIAKENDVAIFILAQLNRSGAREASSINLAESIALARDCDFLFTIYRPDENKNEFFSVRLDSSRHSLSGKEFLLKLLPCGKMIEVDTRFDNSYKTKSFKVPSAPSFYEKEYEDSI